MDPAARPLIVCVWLFALIACPSAEAAEVKIGDGIAPFSVKDLRFVKKTLPSFGQKAAWVVVFTDSSCPVAARAAPLLEALWREYRDRGVQFLAVNASPGDSLVEAAADALEKKITFPAHKDFDQTAMAALGVTRTPEAVIVGADGTLRYRGRIDERLAVAGDSPRVGREDLRLALDAVLAGKPVETAETPVEGCRITRLSPPARQDATWSGEVASIVQARCQPCHRPRTAAPFTLLSFEAAASRAARIREAVAEGLMPPSFQDPRFGRFSTHQPLSERERDTLLGWIDGGLKLGDESRQPPNPTWPEGEWEIGEPDLILEPRQTYEIPASGYVDYKNPVLEPAFAHDTWVSQIQILPGNRAVVHHANLYAVAPRDKGGYPVFLTGYVPGGDVTRYGSHAGVLLPAGWRLKLQIHYAPNGVATTDRTRVGLVFAKETIHRQPKIHFLINRSFAIPPGDPHHQVSASQPLLRPALGLGLFSHMHLRGKDMSFIAHYPDGSSETLLSIPNYSFDWQLAYVFEGQKRFPAGTRLETISHYDNSLANSFNPDPSATVREGQQSYEEMNYGFLFYYDEEEKLAIEVDPKTGAPLSGG